MVVRAGLQCSLTVPWVIKRTEQNKNPNTIYKSNLVNVKCHVKQTFQAITCQICGIYFKTKCDKKSIKKEHNYFFVLRKGYLIS